MANSQFWWPSPIEIYSFMVLELSCPKSRGQGLGKDPSLLLLELPVMASGPKHSLPSRCRTVLSAFVFLWPFSLCVSQSVCFLFFKDNTHWNRAHLTCDVVVQSLKLCLTLQPHKLQHTRLPCPLLSPGICSDSCQWCHPTISSSVIPVSSWFNLSQHQGLFQWVISLQWVAKVLEFQLQHQSFQWIFRTDFLKDWLVWSPCSPRDSEEFSPTPQFKSINSLALSFLYSPTLTSIFLIVMNMCMYTYQLFLFSSLLII